MQNYVDCDGDWSQRHPASLEGMTLYAFVLPARMTALQDLCDKVVNDRPTNGAITAAPLLPAVLLVCASIDFARSADARDGEKGYVVEKDVGFFLPIRLTDNGTTSFAALVPYLFVEPMPAVIAGREVYGFPKELADITFDEATVEFAAESLVIPTYGRNNRVVLRKVVDVSPTGAIIRTRVSGDLADFTRDVTEKVLGALNLTAPGILGVSTPTGFIDVPFVLLKQFRAAEAPLAACYQAIVRTVGTGDAFQHGEYLTGIIDVRVPRFDSLRIEETLGLFDPLGLGQPFHPLLSVAMKLDVDLLLGDVRWQA